jgi:MSHA biogenesis protein MshE
MGAPGYLVASSLKAIVAQRLVRKICDNCGEDHAPNEEQKVWLSQVDANFAGYQFKRGKGCQRCNYIGYRGRIGVFELLQLNEAMMSALKNNDTDAFTQAAQESNGYKPLAMAALDYAKLGIITLDEVMRLVEMVHETEPAISGQAVSGQASQDTLASDTELPPVAPAMVNEEPKPQDKPSGGFTLEDID